HERLSLFRKTNSVLSEQRTELIILASSCQVMSAPKILAREEAARRAEELRRAGKRLVTVNGSFDLLHAGHLVILEEAKAQGDFLFVGMNSDASVRQNKGPERPIIPQEERAHMLAALACVDYVVVVDAVEAGRAIIEAVRPHIHVNGSEYGDPAQWIEHPVMEHYGVTGYVCRRRPGLATSDLIEKIQQMRVHTLEPHS
ncbi:MAG: adenylyltransferase/cytidyltransferase family protein, partial [bacterium]|nr:adenylyltransferase/cytidyltransferase family protein [bacterium]